MLLQVGDETGGSTKELIGHTDTVSPQDDMQGVPCAALTALVWQSQGQCVVGVSSQVGVLAFNTSGKLLASGGLDGAHTNHLHYSANSAGGNSQYSS